MIKGALKIVSELNKAGYTAYFAGGAVRDFILRKEPKDVDIATDATPDEVEKTFRRTKDIGREFGVMMVIEDGEPYDVTTFRSDVGSKGGRWPQSVEFGGEEGDSKRRDFTVNGMFLSVEDPDAGYSSWKELMKSGKWEVIDYNEGINDTRKKVLRFIGKPEDRIGEDHLRVLRAVRFKNELGFKYADGTEEAIRKSVGLISDLSDERIREEMQKGLASANRRGFIEELSEMGLLEKILPEVEELKGVKQGGKYHQEGGVFMHTMMVLDEIKKVKDSDPLLPWIVLMHDTGKKETATEKGGVPHWYGHEKVSAKKARAAMKRLKFSNREVKDAEWVILSGMAYSFERMSIGKKRMLFMGSRAKLLLDFMSCDKLGKKPRARELVSKLRAAYEDAQEFTKRYTELKEFTRGTFIMKISGMKPGPRVGEVSKKVKLAILDEKVTNEDEAKAYIESFGK